MARDTAAGIENESAPIQLAQCWFSDGLANLMLKYKYIFQVKYTEAILSNSTRKLSWFEITKILIAVYFVIYLLFLKPTSTKPQAGKLG